MVFLLIQLSPFQQSHPSLYLQFNLFRKPQSKILNSNWRQNQNLCMNLPRQNLRLQVRRQNLGCSPWLAESFEATLTSHYAKSSSPPNKHKPFTTKIEDYTLKCNPTKARYLSLGGTYHLHSQLPKTVASLSTNNAGRKHHRLQLWQKHWLISPCKNVGKLAPEEHWPLCCIVGLLIFLRNVSTLHFDGSGLFFPFY